MDKKDREKMQNEIDAQRQKMSQLSEENANYLK